MDPDHHEQHPRSSNQGPHANDPSASHEPRCWNCGYGLSGLRVDSLCPECGTPIYAGPPPQQAASGTQNVLIWGIVSIVTLFACIGPLAGLVAIYPIIKGGRILRHAKAANVPKYATQPAKTGFILAWITAGLSILIVVGYGAVFLFLAVSGMSTP